MQQLSGRFFGAVPRLGPRHWVVTLWRTAEGAGSRNLSMMAAGVAFFAMLAVFPAITAIISIYGYLSDPRIVLENLTFLDPVLPDQVSALVKERVERLVTAGRSTLGLASLISMLVAVWSARAGVAALISGLSVIHPRDEPRNFFRGLFVAYLLTFVLIIASLVALAVVVVIPTVLAFAPLGGWQSAVVHVLRWAVALATITVGIGTLYRYGPRRAAGPRPWVSLGTIVASLLWITVSVLFSVYLSNFSDYDQVYGSLGAVVALLIWFYLSAFAVLFGAELDAQIDIAQNAQRRSADTDHAASAAARDNG